jgi:hypothetical protein
MHDMPRVTIVFGKVVDLNQDNEDIYIYRSLYSKKLSTLYQVTLQVYKLYHNNILNINPNTNRYKSKFIQGTRHSESSCGHPGLCTAKLNVVEGHHLHSIPTWRRLIVPHHDMPLFSQPWK